MAITQFTRFKSDKALPVLQYQRALTQYSAMLIKRCASLESGTSLLGQLLGPRTS
jgi:hypothetical protein